MYLDARVMCATYLSAMMWFWHEHLHLGKGSYFGLGGRKEGTNEEERRQKK